MQDSHTLPPEKVHLHSFPLYMITSLCVMCLGSSLNCSFFLFFFFITMHDSCLFKRHQCANCCWYASFDLRWYMFEHISSAHQLWQFPPEHLHFVFCPLVCCFFLTNTSTSLVSPDGSRVRSSPSSGATRQNNLLGCLQWHLSSLWRPEVCGQSLQVVSPHPFLWFLHSGARSTWKVENRTAEGTRWEAFSVLLISLHYLCNIKNINSLHIK